MTYQEALDEAVACLKRFIEEEAEKPEDRWDRDGLVSRAEDALHYLQWPDADEGEAEKPEDRWERDLLVSRAEDALHYMEWPDADEDEDDQ